MGEEAARILINQIENKSYNSENFIFPVTLDPGGSIADLRV
jgi:DNA-binding LacI/PurR family transcriptional regulator